jgi:lysophospholipase L1-like esterase
MRFLLAGVLTALGVAASAGALAHKEHSFVASWAVGHIQPLPANVVSFNNQTLREVVRLSAGGEYVRVSIANTFGSETLAVGEARVAVSGAGAAIVPGTSRVLTFGGERSIDVRPGSRVLSDPVRLNARPLQQLSISLYLPGASAAETTTLFQGTSFVSLSSGNHTGAVELPSASPVAAWPFVFSVNVGSKKGESIVALTDSATLTSEWPRFLGERLQARSSTDHLAVVSMALAGNRMLHNSAGPTGPNPQWGQSLLARFDRDVLGQAGVKHVIVFIGLNDIAGPGAFYPAAEAITVEDLIAGYRQLVARAREKGLTIQACTLPPLQGNTSLPGFDTPENEAKRVAYNHWIRTSGEFDGVIDVDRVLRDPANPKRLLPAYDSGDHLHPNAAGGRAIAEAIDLRVFR